MEAALNYSQPQRNILANVSAYIHIKYDKWQNWETITASCLTGNKDTVQWIVRSHWESIFIQTTSRLKTNKQNMPFQQLFFRWISVSQASSWVLFSIYLCACVITLKLTATLHVLCNIITSRDQKHSHHPPPTLYSVEWISVNIFHDIILHTDDTLLLQLWFFTNSDIT